MDHSPADSPPSPPQRRWQPLEGIDCRVVGVLAEKAKTTPDGYPMSLNAIRTGCNQKSNRRPLMELESDEVEESLDRLRSVGAVGLVEGYGRVQKYRHYLYEWLSVDKVELAVMTELLLRGEQTVGELRARAARMEPIADQAALRPVLDSLKSKGLVIDLTPEGRGQVVGHALYTPREMKSLRSRHRGCAATGTPAEQPPSRTVPAAASPEPPADSVGIDRFIQELSDIREQMAQTRRELDELRACQSRTSDELLALKKSLGE
ncbi:MAG: YceH family protein [Planctomycetes bacterium]|nr:YceH family protein [Planctomycetota bacterium]MCG2683446.1 YceH family protein [Planctomycetales bacterium]